MIWREVRVGGVEYVIRIGKDVLELDGEGGAGVGIANNWYDVIVVFVFLQFNYEVLVFA